MELQRRVDMLRLWPRVFALMGGFEGVVGSCIAFWLGILWLGWTARKVHSYVILTAHC
jgi:hypothetical protein